MVTSLRAALLRPSLFSQQFPNSFILNDVHEFPLNLARGLGRLLSVISAGPMGSQACQGVATWRWTLGLVGGSGSTIILARPQRLKEAVDREGRGVESRT